MRDAVERMRRFNRFYTRLVGVLDEGHLESPFSLAEARVLYELAHRRSPTASDIARDLALDAGYMSRMVKKLERKKIVRRTAAENDARQSLLHLTPAGRASFEMLDARAHAAVADLLEKLDAHERERATRAMTVIEGAFDDSKKTNEKVTLRAHRIGDMGAIVARQAIVYATEYGWNAEYEALTARIVADFIERFDPSREACWIAEKNGEMAGSVFLIRHPERPGVAKLRLLYVEPFARGLGIGRRLVRECTSFAKRAGYHRITLWTNDVLASARRIYEAEGYELVDQKKHHSFGKDLVAQTWEMGLQT